MKRVRRWIFNGIAALSLLMATTTTAAWIASFWVYGHEMVAMPLWIGDPHQIFFIADRSSVSFCFREYGGLISQQEDFGLVNNPSAWFHDMHLLGFRLFYGDECAYSFIHVRGWDHKYGFGIPVILAVPLLLVLPVTLFKKMRQATKMESGSCVSCGYDLRATPDRCPECGTIPQRK